MAVAFRSATTTRQDGTATTISGTVPAGTQANDVLIAVFSQDYDGKSTNYPTPTGWQLAGAVQVAGTNQYQPGCAVFWRAATGSEPASYTFTGVSTSSKVLTLSAWSGVDNATPFAVAPTYQVDAAGTSHPTPALAAGAGQAAGGAALFFAATDYYDTAYGNSYTLPAGTTLVGQISSVYVYSALAYQAVADTSAIPAKTFTANRASQDPAQTMVAVLNPTSATTTKTAADQATVTDQATTSATQPVSDQATVADSAAVGELHQAADQATITDQISTQATRPVSDAATVTEQITSQASFTAADSTAVTDTVSSQASFGVADQAAVADQSKVGPSVTDPAALAEQVTSTAYFGRSDTVTLAEGASVESLYGDLVISLYGVDPASGALVPLPDFTKLTLSPQRNSAGSVSIDYPDVGQNFSWLYANTVGRDADLEVEIWNFGSATGALRAILHEAAGDDVSEDKTEWTFAGVFLEKRLSEGEVWPQPLVGETTLGANVEVPKTSVTDAQWQRLQTLGYQPNSDNTSISGVPQKVLDAVKANASTIPVLADPKRELKFSAVTPGAAVIFMMAQARTRGTLVDVVCDFTASTDSSGAAWPKVLTTKFSPGARYDQILSKLVDLGLVEWAVQWTGSARALRMWVPGNRGVDRTVGPRPVVLRAGRNIAESPRKWSVKDASTAVLSVGAEGFYGEASSVDAQTRRGRRIESSASAQSLNTTDAVSAYAQWQLGVSTSGTLEIDHGLGFLPGEPRPLIAFDVGDWIYSQTSTTLDRYRIVQWSLTVDNDQNPSGVVVLNDQHTDALIRAQERLDAITSGDTVVGTSTQTQGTGTPSPPTGLLIGSGAFNTGADAYALVTVSWTAPTTNVDGTALTDLGGYRVEWTEYANPNSWRFAADVGPQQAQAQFTTATGLPILVRVRAYNTSGRTSTWLTLVSPHTTDTDTTPPGVPSTPTGNSYLGVVSCTWDGKTTSGADMYGAYPDFKWCELHMSPASNFTPSSTTLLDKVFGRGTYSYSTDAAGADLPYGTTQYFKLISVDLRGNKSAASGQASATPAPVVSSDVFDGAIGTAKLQDAAIVTAKIADLAVNDAKIGSLSVGKLTAGILTASMIVGTGKIATGTTGARVEIDSSGMRLYDSGSNINVQLKTADGSAMIAGEYRTSLTTGKRMVFNPNGSSPDEIRFYPASTNQYGRMRTITSVALGFENQAGMTIKAFSPADDGESGELSAFPSYASIAYANEMDGGAVTTRLAASSGNAYIGGPKIDMGYASGGYCNVGRSIGNNYQPRTLVRIGPRDGGDNSNAAIGVVNQHSYLQFDTGILSVVNDGALINIQANAFVTGSERHTKTAIEKAPFDPRNIVRGADFYTYEKRGQPLVPGHRNPRQVGLMVDELPPELVVTNVDEGWRGVDLYGAIAVLWGVARHQDVELAELRARLDGPGLRSVA